MPDPAPSRPARNIVGIGIREPLADGVRMCSAIGDESDETDTIQADIDATPTSGMLVFPRPRNEFYGVDGGLVIDRAITLMGMGSRAGNAAGSAIHLKCSDNTKSVIKVQSYTGLSAIQGNQLEIDGFQIEGGKYGIHIDTTVGGDLSLIRNMFFLSQATASIYYDDDANCQRLRWEDILINGSGSGTSQVGFLADAGTPRDGGTALLHNQLVRFRISNVNVGIKWRTENNTTQYPVSAHSLIIESCDSYGMYLEGGFLFDIFSGHFEKNGDVDGSPDMYLGGIQSDTPVTRCQVMLNNYLFSTASDAQLAVDPLGVRAQVHSNQCHIYLKGCQIGGSQIFDFNNKTSGGQFVALGGDAPTMRNLGSAQFQVPERSHPTQIVNKVGSSIRDASIGTINAGVDGKTIAGAGSLIYDTDLDLLLYKNGGAATSPWHDVASSTLQYLVGTSARTAALRWVVSGSGTNEYYVELVAGGDPSIAAVASVHEDDATAMSSGTVGSLSAGEYDYGDNDTLGFSTIYVRLTSGGPDPDSEALGHIRYILT